MLVLDEPDSAVASQVFQLADRRSTSVITYAECRAAIAAAERRRRFKASDARKAVSTLDDLWETLDRVAVTEAIVHQAGDLADRLGLRGLDSIHLASTIALMPDVALACWDKQLTEAAAAEGIRSARPKLRG